MRLSVRSGQGRTAHGDQKSRAFGRHFRETDESPGSATEELPTAIEKAVHKKAGRPKLPHGLQKQRRCR
jgi:hypothetical protein